MIAFGVAEAILPEDEVVLALVVNLDLERVNHAFQDHATSNLAFPPGLGAKQPQRIVPENGLVILPVCDHPVLKGHEGMSGLFEDETLELSEGAAKRRRINSGGSHDNFPTGFSLACDGHRVYTPTPATLRFDGPRDPAIRLHAMADELRVTAHRLDPARRAKAGGPPPAFLALHRLKPFLEEDDDLGREWSPAVVGHFPDDREHLVSSRSDTIVRPGSGLWLFGTSGFLTLLPGSHRRRLQRSSGLARLVVHATRFLLLRG